MSSANEDKCDCDDSFREMKASHLLVWRTLSRNGVNLCRVVRRTGCQKGGHFYHPRLKVESGRTKDIDSSIYLDVDMFFLHTFVHETDMKCLCLLNKSCIWVSAIAFRSPPSVVSAHSRLRRFLDHLLSEWISTKHQMKVGQVALIGQRGEGVLHYTGFFFTVINIFRALHQRTNWFNAQLRVGPWLERGHSVDFKRPLASEWSFHGSQLCYASPVHFNSFDLHSWWIN